MRHSICLLNLSLRVSVRQWTYPCTSAMLLVSPFVRCLISQSLPSMIFAGVLAGDRRDHQERHSRGKCQAGAGQEGQPRPDDPLGPAGARRHAALHPLRRLRPHRRPLLHAARCAQRVGCALCLDDCVELVSSFYFPSFAPASKRPALLGILLCMWPHWQTLLLKVPHPHLCMASEAGWKSRAHAYLTSDQRTCVLHVGKEHMRISRQKMPPSLSTDHGNEGGQASSSKLSPRQQARTLLSNCTLVSGSVGYGSP